MAITLVNADRTGGGIASNSTILSGSFANTSGNLLIAMVFWQLAASITGILDTAGNSWLQVPGAHIGWGGANNNLDIWYVLSAKASAGDFVTVSLSSPGTYRSIAFLEFNSSTGAWTFDVVGTPANGSGTSLATGNLAITGTDDLIVAIMEADSQGQAGGAGFSLTQFNSPGDPTPFFADEWKEVSAAQVADATCASGGWGISAAAFSTVAPAAVSASVIGPFPTYRPDLP